MNASLPPESLQRSRIRCVVLIALIVATGLLWRSGILSLPPAVWKYGGDALWALLIFVGLGAIFTRASTLVLGLTATGYSFATEFFQLYQAPWLDSIRSTRLGHLVLGSTFNWPDLIAYTIGVTVGAAVEIWVARFRRQRIHAS